VIRRTRGVQAGADNRQAQPRCKQEIEPKNRAASSCSCPIPDLFPLPVPPRRRARTRRRSGIASGTRRRQSRARMQSRTLTRREWLGRVAAGGVSYSSTPEVRVEGWMAVQTRDGRHLLATVSDPALFMFQNLEYACIHSATGFGRLAPGETGAGRNRVYFIAATIEEWHQRMRRDLSAPLDSQRPGSP